MLTFKEFLEEEMESVKKVKNNPLGVLNRYARRKGVALNVLDHNSPKNRLPDPDYWHLAKIQRQTGQKGSGGDVMRALNKKADQHQKNVSLHRGLVGSQPHSTEHIMKRLEDYYNNFGYDSEPTYPGRMVRKKK